MMAASYRTYLLILLMLLLSFNYVDRLALGLLLQDIKVDLNLSDTQLGLLTGLAFALFYSIMGVPIARWADRGNRATIISLTTAIWSVGVVLCGLAGNFVHLLLIRIGVAVGEAGCLPPAHSLIADYFKRAERARAVAIFGLGAPLSMVAGYFGAGWLNELYGWRITFMLLGIPGVILAALAWFTLREPRGRLSNAQADGGRATPSRIQPQPEGDLPDQPAFRTVCETLWSNRTFRHLLLCFAVASFFAQGTMQWQPTFFIRSYGLGTGELGTWLAVLWGGGGLLGTYLGGELASRYAANNEQLQLKAMALVYCGFGIISACIYLSPNLYLTFALIGVSAVGVSTISSPLFATIQTLVPPQMRATSIALIFLVANLIGMGLGPLAAGFLSDAFQPWSGDESLRYALLALCPGYAWGGWHLWQGSKTVARDVASVEADPTSLVDEEIGRAKHPDDISELGFKQTFSR